jgi:hypothetical protein
MMISRRRFIETGVLGAAGASALAGTARAQSGGTAAEKEVRADLAGRLRTAAAAPVLRKELFSHPVTLAKVELLRNGRFFLVRARSTDGALGLAEGHGPVLESAWPILVQKVAPHMSGSGLGFLYAAHFASFAPMGPIRSTRVPTNCPCRRPPRRFAP